MSATTPICKIVSVPGQKGNPGDDGADGVDGLDASSVLGVGFTMPAFNADTPSLLMDSSEWMVPGQNVYVGLAGTMRVQSKADATHAVLRNLEDGISYTENVPPGTVIASGQRVSPGGLQGPTGATPASTLDDLSPTTAKGQILVDDGVNAPLASLVAHGPGADGEYLKWDAVSADGTTGENPWPASAADNRLVRFDGVTGRKTKNGVMAETDSGDFQVSTGNAKGTNAVDLQTQRSNVAMVASGTRAAVSGGSDNTGGGNNATIPGGFANTTAANFATVGGGSSNLANAQGATVPGGESNVASGIDSIATGAQCQATGPYTQASGLQAAANVHGMKSHNAGVFAALADSNTIDLILRNVTTNATPTALFCDGSSVKITPSGGQTFVFQGSVTAVRGDVAGIGDSAGWTFTGLLACFYTPVLVAACVPVLVAASAGAAAWAVTVTVVGADLVITVTGQAAPANIRWRCDIRFNVAGWLP